jgi:hypothetical protein
VDSVCIGLTSSNRVTFAYEPTGSGSACQPRYWPSSSLEALTSVEAGRLQSGSVRAAVPGWRRRRVQMRFRIVPHERPWRVATRQLQPVRRPSPSRAPATPTPIRCSGRSRSRPGRGCCSTTPAAGRARPTSPCCGPPCATPATSPCPRAPSASRSPAAQVTVMEPGVRDGVRVGVAPGPARRSPPPPGGSSRAAPGCCPRRRRARRAPATAR